MARHPRSAPVITSMVARHDLAWPGLAWPGSAWSGPEGYQQRARQKPAPGEIPTYPLGLEKTRIRVEEGALWSPEAIYTHTKQSVQGSLSPIPDRHLGPPPMPDTQAQQLGTSQEQQTWRKHNTTQVNGVQQQPALHRKGRKRRRGSTQRWKLHLHLGAAEAFSAPDYPGHGPQRYINEGPLNRLDGRRTIKDPQPPAQALLSLPTPPTTTKQAASPSRPHRSLFQAENAGGEGTKNGSDSAGSDPIRLPRPPTPSTTTTVTTAAPVHFHRQPQATIRPNLTPLTLPAILRLSRDVHTPMASDPGVRPHINHGLRQAGQSCSVADKLPRTLGLLSTQEILQITQLAGPEPGQDYRIKIRSPSTTLTFPDRQAG